jgi:hypothetical protein
MAGQPEKPRWQSSVLSVGTAIQTAVIAAGFALIIWKRFIWQQLSPALGFALFLLIFIVLAAAFYVPLKWIFFEHPAEISKKLPISSRELRKKKTQFFDNLPK